MLLSISEPNSKKTKTTIGIDLGTTNSLVATSINSEVQILEFENSNLVPSIVFYGNNEVLVGKQAKNKLLTDPQNTIISIKRFMGLSYEKIDSLSVNKYITENGQFLTQQGYKNSVEISSEILKKLNQIAKNQLDQIEGIVITVPAYFDDNQRNATKQAALLADLPILRLINEPTAAAIAYGLEQKQRGNIIVYDLGGGTFDVSILNLIDGIFEVLATGGHNTLGGDDFDELIFEYIKEKLKLKKLDWNQTRILLEKSKIAKESFTNQDEIFIEFENQKICLNKDTFNKIISPLIKETINITKKTIREAKLKIEEIDEIILVGGSTKINLITELIKENFNKNPLKTIDGDKVVAIGAALHAEALMNNKKEYLLMDVLPLSLGIETMGGLVEKIIRRNSTIPCAKTQEFTTYQNGQGSMKFNIVQGERELVQDCRSLGEFTLSNIPKMVAGAAKVQVTFIVDADGILTVQAKELKTGIFTSISVKPSENLNDHFVRQNIQNSIEYAEEDKNKRALIEDKIFAKSIISATKTSLEEDGKLISDEEVLNIVNIIENLEKSLLDNKRDLIKILLDDLNKATEKLAALRLNKVAKQSLEGKKI